MSRRGLEFRLVLSELHVWFREELLLVIPQRPDLLHMLVKEVATLVGLTIGESYQAPEWYLRLHKSNS